MIQAILNYTFMQNAFLAGILASVVCGIIGTVIVEKRLVSMSGGIAHTSFGGIGLGYLTGIEPIFGGLGFGLLAAVSIAAIKRRTNTYTDTLIGIFWSSGMALGILFIAMMPGYPPDMTTYLFGDILTVSSVYVRMMLLLTVLIVTVFALYFNYWKAFLFDDMFMKVQGMNVALFEYILYIMIALSIVLLIKVVGIILVIALLTIPPAIAKLHSKDLKGTVLIAIGVGIVLTAGGLVVSYYSDIPSGATIILLSAAVYLGNVLFKKKG